MTSRSVSLAAPAKVNLFLRVLDRRTDGYHELETLFQAVSLTDELSVTLAGADCSQIRLRVEGPDLGPVESNLAYRAASRFAEETGLTNGIDLTLVKHIPAGAGLGGGSSDAAAVLRCLAELTDTDDAELLFRIGSELGSDVPFFLAQSPTVLASGRGEQLTELTPLPQAHLVLALPPVQVSTVEAYGTLAEARTRRLEAPKGQDTRYVGAGGGLDDLDWARVVDLACNDFGPVIIPAHSQIGESIEGLQSAGASLALLSGSGAASFGIFPSAGEAARAARDLEHRLGWRFVPVRTMECPTNVIRGFRRA